MEVSPTFFTYSVYEKKFKIKKYRFFNVSYYSQSKVRKLTTNQSRASNLLIEKRLFLGKIRRP
jgi:hypothetical protein